MLNKKNKIKKKAKYIISQIQLGGQNYNSTLTYIRIIRSNNFFILKSVRTKN